jgi:hypothetical protein
VKIAWDIVKAARNLKKHGVSFDEAATVFYDPLSLTEPDHDHSIGENRFITLGLSSINRLLFVAHSDDNETIRIISAREAMKSERILYEQA